MRKIEIYDYIKNIMECEVLMNNKDLIPPFLLDFIIPLKFVVIEYCELLDNSEQYGKTRYYHLNKLKECNDNGYKLITIFEDEWICNKELLKSKISHILGVDNKKRIYARKCGITEISSGIASKFCNENHIQGYTGASKKLGLYNNGRISAVMTFSKPSLSKGNRKSSKNIWELSRYCTNCNVIGGAGKMFKFFQRNYLWREIFSFADKRWSDGNLYMKLGFEKLNDTEPNYYYFYINQDYKNYKRYHRFNFRKQELKKKLKQFDPKSTEYENMINNGWDRIWDCGNYKFILKNEYYTGKL